MREKFTHRIFHYGTGLPVKKLILGTILLLILFFQGCSFYSSRRKPQLLLTSYDIRNIIQDVEKQNEIVSGFYSTGTLTINGWIVDTSLDVFIAGNRAPLMLKLEISHSWGKPILFLLIRDGKLEIRDFIDKKQYTGEFTSENLSRFLPDIDCSPEMIWSFLRGYPEFPPYISVYERTPGVLTLEDSGKNSLGEITFLPGEGIKEAESLPPRSPGMKFTGFRKTGDVDYAEKTVVEDIRGKRDLTLKRKKAVFNKKIPNEIFTLKNRPLFEAVRLSD